jgi:outer membrane protein TolC
LPEKAQRFPSSSFTSDYGGAGVNVRSFNSVYTVAGSVSFPIYTGGCIRADVDEARATLTRRQAEYEDLKGRVAYDVRVAWLDLQASDSGVKVAERNRALAERALTQSRDRYSNGVTNYLEVVQAQETLTAAEETTSRLCIHSTFQKWRSRERWELLSAAFLISLEGNNMA